MNEKYLPCFGHSSPRVTIGLVRMLTWALTMFGLS